MPRTGRPPKPVELKRRLGNPGKRALPKPVTALAPVTVVEVAAPTSGADLATALLDAGAGTWIGQTDRLGLLSLLVDAWDERAALRADLAANGWAYTSYSKVAGEQRKIRPEVVRLEKLEKQITSWLSLLGLTPTDRTRLGVAEVRARSTLEELRARREERGRRAG
jgi:P27 family predicted phage terminase small subunit